MHVLGMQVQLHLREVHSLKEKRSIVRAVIDGVRVRWGVSVGEVADNDVHQSAVLGIALVGSRIGVLDDVADQIERFMWSRHDVEVGAISRRWLDMD